VVLVHGWGGHAGRLTEFVGPLVRKGFSVIAFDAPGHGDAAGRYSSLPEFVDAIRAVAQSNGPVEALIGHSLGAGACALAIRGGLPVSRAVLLAPPADAEKYAGKFARFFRIPPNTHDAMKRRLEERYRIHWPDLKVAAGDCPARVLVFHDPRDGKVPFRDGVEVVQTWSQAKLVKTPGLGHHRILADRHVIRRAVAFIGNPDRSVGVGRRSVRLSAAFAS
jgi:pimeloyl-ACP methyl ester carboxylesterase